MKSRTLRALLVDPSLFTAPYDAALTRGLRAASVEPTWAVRPIRRGDRQEIPVECSDPFFYRRVDEASWLPSRARALAKGIAHAWGLVQLVRRTARLQPDVVHFQWTVLPALDALAIWVLRRTGPVVLTVHDTQPFNGERPSAWQNLAFDLPIRLADQVIVHTRAGRVRLCERGLDESKVCVIPHGPLTLPDRAPNLTPAVQRVDARWTFTLFGELKHYKGIDLLVEAVALLPAELRARARFIVAGRVRMDLSGITSRIAELGLSEAIELRASRHSEAEMAELFEQSDCFVFPYRQVDASGVYFLVKSYAKWIIATRLGVFAEDLEQGAQGALIAANDAGELAAAMAEAIATRPVARCASASCAWEEIGEATRAVYMQAGRRFRALRAARRRRASSAEDEQQGHAHSLSAAGGRVGHQPRM